MKPKLFLLIPLTLALSRGCLSAQTNFNVSWFTIAGGGGPSTGGVYSVSATIGQPAAGTMSGGNYSLQAGFWSLLGVVQSSNAPVLAIKGTDSGVVIVSWPAPSTGWVLQQTSALAPRPELTVWTDVVSPPVVVVGGENTVTFTAASGNRFFRLRPLGVVAPTQIHGSQP